MLPVDRHNYDALQSSPPRNNGRGFLTHPQAQNRYTHLGKLVFYALFATVYVRLFLFGGWGRTLRPISSIPDILSAFLDLNVTATSSMNVSSTTHKADTTSLAIIKTQRFIHILPDKEEMVRSVEINGIDPRGMESIVAWNGWVEASQKSKTLLRQFMKRHKLRHEEESHQEDAEDELDQPRKRETAKKRTSPSRLLPFLILLMMCTMLRTCIAVIFQSYADALDRVGEDDDDVEAIRSAFTSALRQNLSRAPRSMTAAELQSIARRARRARSRILVNQINAARARNGQGPISTESLRLILNDRDFTGDDYEGLARLDEENATASETAAGPNGITQEEINSRCPSRVILSADDTLIRDGSHSCAICLHPFCLNESVRSLTCSHTFHCGCIDPWLMQRADCPICKRAFDSPSQ